MFCQATPPPVSGTPGNTTLLSLFGILVILYQHGYPLWKGSLHNRRFQTVSILFHVFLPGEQAIHSETFRDYQLHPACLHFLQAFFKQKDIWPSMPCFSVCESWQRWFSPWCTQRCFMCIPSRIFCSSLVHRNAETLKLSHDTMTHACADVPTLTIIKHH